MQLNIYIISHPIIQQLSSQITCSTTKTDNTYNRTCKQLGFLMIYEVMRTWMQVQNIYIKKINQTKQLCILKKEESYIVFTDLINSHNIITEAIDLIPQVELNHVNFEQKSIPNENIHYSSQVEIKQKQKVIIINLKFNNNKIIHFLDYLIIKKHVKISQIKIICITCKHQVLEKMGNKYPALNIYTTNIT
uniref:uracil phosphoribosyltransferase n=1 Tax=Polyopes affinis TaxID=194519 RepID=UPI002A832570|nr:uracil phosphoribosyltransferase [Polyopes affinis]WOL37007.1 uracil phosphoribosyltransferase [Polyopes affinis]